MAVCLNCGKELSGKNCVKCHAKAHFSPLYQKIKIHKIVFTEEETEMHDLTVEDNHNFILDNGILSHNSGKSLTAVKLMVDNFDYIVTDIKLSNLPKEKVHQLKWADIIKPVRIEKDGKIKTGYDINWDFWSSLRKNHKNYCICIDETHNIISSRRSMSTTNILFSKMISQIRKILADDNSNCMIVITQALRAAAAASSK